MTGIKKQTARKSFPKPNASETVLLTLNKDKETLPQRSPHLSSSPLCANVSNARLELMFS